MCHGCGANPLLGRPSLLYRLRWRIIVVRYLLILGITFGIIIGIIIISNGVLGYRQDYLDQIHLEITTPPALDCWRFKMAVLVW